MIYLGCVLTLGLLLTGGAGGGPRSAGAWLKPAAAADLPVGERVQLYFVRQGTKVKALLDRIGVAEGSTLKGLLVETVDENELVLFGKEEQRRDARRIIAALDLPRAGVDMEMWGFQISSSKPDKMAVVLQEAQQDISRARYAVRETFQQLQLRAGLHSDATGGTDSTFATLLSDLGYVRALRRDRPLSLSDILLRLIASPKPGEAAVSLANGLTNWLDEHGEYRWYADQLRKRNSVPFERFFRQRGLTHDGKNWTVTGSSETPGVRVRSLADEHVRISRAVVLRFALNYRDYVRRQGGYSPYYLQQTADALNGRLQLSVDALSQDINELFITPTLDRIRSRVAKLKDVDFAQVGRTHVATLTGTPTKIEGSAVSAFDVTPPLRLSELLANADKLSKQIGGFIPKVPVEGTEAIQESVVTGGIPVSQLMGLIAAFGEERSVWRELASGVSLDITPNVLRNASSAELAVRLSVADPQSGTRESGVPPISRISKHTVDTKVYIDSLDLFDLSTFSSQATLNGGRGYVPVLGTIWRGIFSDVPVVGNLFSWKKGPKKVYHQSIVLASSIITPTAMNLALLLELDPADRATEAADPDAHFRNLTDRVTRYIDNLED